MSLLEEVPSILDYVTPKTMAALLSSSSSLRRLVHISANALTIKKAHLRDTTALVNGGWSQLKHLDLSRSQIDLTLMSALVQGHWPVLQSLKLVKCYLSCEAVRLLDGGEWSSLECLELGKNGLRLEAYVWLGKSKWPKLRKLVLKDPQQRLDHEMCRELAKAEWPLLHELCLDFNEINGECIDELNVAWPLLEVLKATGLTPAATITLTESKWQNLKALYVEDWEGATAVEHWTHAIWPLLNKLSLCEAVVTFTAAAIANFKHLQVVELVSCRLQHGTCAALTFLSPFVKRLSLWHSPLTEDILEAFEGVTWSQLECLDLSYTRLTPQSLHTWAREHWPVLRRLHLNSCIPSSCDLAALGHWKLLHLQCLQLRYACFKSDEAVSQLITAHLPCLKEVVLEGSSLGNEGLIRLVKGKWRSLEILNLHNRLDNHCLGVLLRADWPDLQQLNLSQNRLGVAAYQVLGGPSKPLLGFGRNVFKGSRFVASQQLCAKWPMLQYLDLSNHSGHVQWAYNPEQRRIDSNDCKSTVSQCCYIPFDIGSEQILN